MKNTIYRLHPWLVPVALVALAALLTVPWSYLVVQAAYDRDVAENARSLARRVELQHKFSYADAGGAMSLLFPLGEKSREQQMKDALSTEIRSDPSVQTLVFYNILYNRTAEAGTPQPALVEFLAILGKPNSTFKQLTREDVLFLNKVSLKKQDDAKNQTQQFFIPWKKDGRVVGVTYVELSNQALKQEFWKKEWGLLIQVVAWSVTGVLALSGVGIFAWRSWQKAGHIEERAELTQQGLRAERGLTAAVLAHEIRNPLQALRFQIHSLRKNNADPTRVTATSETIDSELLRIQQLVTDYLEHERAASMRVQTVDLRQAAETLKTVMGELLRSTDTELTITAPPQPVRATCDPHALRQVLMNLVLNAQQAMGHGGSITIAIGRDEPFGTIDVTDTGPGIPDEMRARLFKPFQTSKHDGHGIGLALVKRFVDNVAGSVTVDSAIGKGTTFHLRLPLAETETVAAHVETVNNVVEAEKIGAG